MSNPETVGDNPEKQFYYEVLDVMLDHYRETSVLDDLDLTAIAEVDTVERLLLVDDIKGVLQAGLDLRAKVAELAGQLPDDLRCGSWAFVSIIDRVIALDDAESEEDELIKAPEGIDFFQLSPALLIAARVVDRTVTGVFNNTHIVASADASLAEVQHDYWRVHFVKHGLQA